MARTCTKKMNACRKGRVSAAGRLRLALPTWFGRRAAPPPPAAAASPLVVECYNDNDCGDASKRVCDRARHRCLARDSKEGRAYTAHFGTDVFDAIRARGRKAAGGHAIEAHDWALRPGDAGFNAYAVGLLQAAELDRTMECATTTTAATAHADRWYQRTLSWLVHPKTPIRRLLVAWQLGVGKTIGMIRVLENFFDDATLPKILMRCPCCVRIQHRHRPAIFPTDALVTNFYRELAVVPNRYHSHYRVHRQKEEPDDAPAWPGSAPPAATVEAEAKREAERIRYVDDLRDFLARWPVAWGGRRSSGLPAPLRAFSYAEAGSQAIKRDNAVLRWPMSHMNGYVDRTGDAVPDERCFDHTLVLFDEAHNLLRGPSNAVLRKRVENARNGVVVLYTATPVVHTDGPDVLADAKDILRITKGRENATKADEGFISSKRRRFMDRPQNLFASTSRPLERMLPVVREVYIDENPHTGKPSPYLWQTYLHGRFGTPLPPTYAPVTTTEATKKGGKVAGPATMTKTTKKKASARIIPRGQPGFFDYQDLSDRRRPCIDGTGNADRRPCPTDWSTLEHHVFDGLREEAQLGLNGLTLETAAEMAPKLYVIAQSVRHAADSKTVILIHAANGVHTLVRMLQLFGVDPLVLLPPPPLTKSKTPSVIAEHHRVRFENNKRIAAFNDPIRNVDPVVTGFTHRVLVAVAEEFGEGVSFRNVRRVILADLSPGTDKPSFALLQQRIGRALRACSHAELPPHLRRLDVELYVAKHDQTPRYPPTIDEEKLTYLDEEVGRMTVAMDYLRVRAIDAEYFVSPATDRGRSIKALWDDDSPVKTKSGKWLW